MALRVDKKDKPVQKVLQKLSRVFKTALKLCQLALTDIALQETQHELDALKYIEHIDVVFIAGIQQNQQEFQWLVPKKGTIQP